MTAWRHLRVAGMLGSLIAGLVVSPPPAAASHVAVERVAGADRFETAVRFAQGLDVRSRPEGETVTQFPHLFLTTGTAFADAITAGAIAANHNSPMPLLLTGPDSLPAATRAELARLRPGEVVVVGGTAAISDAVLTEVGGIVGDVRRIAGADRYATAGALSRAFHGPGAESVYVATGESFADALVASAVAGSEGAGVLLTASTGLPAATVRELERLQPRTIHVIGGPAAVPEAQVEALAAYATDGVVTRTTGADRYEVSARAAEAARRGRALTHAFVATGEDFPDALAMLPLAGSFGSSGAVLLSQRDCLPGEVARVVRESGATSVVLAGGEGALGAGVARLETCDGTSATPEPGDDPTDGDGGQQGDPDQPVDPSPDRWGAVGYGGSANSPHTTTYNRNSTGASNEFTRLGVGSYRVVGRGLHPATLPQLTTGHVPALDARCTITDWGGTRDDVEVHIGCVDDFGPVDAPWDLTLTEFRHGVLRAAASFNPTPTGMVTGFTHPDGAVSAVRQDEGLYEVRVTSAALRDGTAKVSAYGAPASDAVACHADTWEVAPDGSGTDIVVACFGPNGPMDANFAFSMVSGESLAAPTASIWAYGAVVQAEDGAFAVLPTRSAQSNGGAASVTGDGGGAFTVRLPGLASAGVALHVAPYIPGDVMCRSGSRTASGADLVVRVHCAERDGAPADVPFAYQLSA